MSTLKKIKAKEGLKWKENFRCLYGLNGKLPKK